MNQVKALVSALGRLMRARKDLNSREHALANRERKLVADIGQALSAFKYRLVRLDEDGVSSRTRVNRRPRVRRDLKCPKCERRFSFAMHVARHMNAMHSRKKRSVGKAAA